MELGEAHDGNDDNNVNAVVEEWEGEVADNTIKAHTQDMEWGCIVGYCGILWPPFPAPGLR